MSDKRRATRHLAVQVFLQFTDQAHLGAAFGAILHSPQPQLRIGDLPVEQAGKRIAAW
jgi:hypothetical protein